MMPSNFNYLQDEETPCIMIKSIKDLTTVPGLIGLHRKVTAIWDFPFNSDTPHERDIITSEGSKFTNEFLRSKNRNLDGKHPTLMRSRWLAILYTMKTIINSGGYHEKIVASYCVLMSLKSCFFLIIGS